jgi:cytochrome c2
MAPKTAIPGTAMAFAGRAKPEERADVIAYVRTLSDMPVALPPPPPPAVTASLAPPPVADKTALAGHPEAGEVIFRRCAACHRLGPDATNSVGPVLNGVVGRTAGTYPGYSYSDANKTSGVVWTEKALAAYLPGPTTWHPGNENAHRPA